MSPHPYRLAMSCLDTPPPPYEPPKRRWVPIEALVLACAVVAAGTGIATFHAVHQPAGHVEVGPAAFARLRVPKRTLTKRVEPPAAPVAQAPLLRGGTHDPKTLLTTAKQLQAYGLDLTITEVQMAKPFASWPDTYLDFWPARFVSVYGPGHHLDGLELHAIPAESPLREAGLAD